MTKIVAQSESVSSETAYQFKGVKKKKKNYTVEKFRQHLDG